MPRSVKNLIYTGFSYLKKLQKWSIRNLKYHNSIVLCYVCSGGMFTLQNAPKQNTCSGCIPLTDYLQKFNNINKKSS